MLDFYFNPRKPQPINPKRLKKGETNTNSTLPFKTNI